MNKIDHFKSCAGESWSLPHESTNEIDGKVYEWHKGNRGLMVVVDAVGAMNGIRIWGPNIRDEMADFDPLTEFAEAWSWLMGGEFTLPVLEES